MLDFNRGTANDSHIMVAMMLPLLGLIQGLNHQGVERTEATFTSLGAPSFLMSNPNAGESSTTEST